MILDNEDILINEVKEVVNKPFCILNGYLKTVDKNDEDGFLSADKNIIKSILDNINLPDFEKCRCEWYIGRFEIDLNIFRNEDNLFIAELLHISLRKSGLHVVMISERHRLVMRHFIGGDYRKILYFIHNLESLYNFDTKSYETISVLDIL